MRKVKILGLMLVAVFAVNVVAAATASGEEYTAESYSTTLTGKKDPTATAADLFVTTAGNVSCQNPTYHGTLTGPTTTVLVTPTYHECTGFGFPATIDTEGCHFLFHLVAGTSTTGTVDVNCTEGKEITVTAISAGTVKCTVHVPSQAVGGVVHYSNIGEGATREVTLNATLEKISYSHTKGTGLGACPAGSAAGGTLTATGVVTGEVVGGTTHVGVFLS